MNLFDIDALKDIHNKKFSGYDIIIKSPGRANIIGEHTDYNHGLVLPFAIQQSVYLIISKNETGSLRLHANDIDAEQEHDMNHNSFVSEGWYRYFVNVLHVLDNQFEYGLDVTFGGDLPFGVGVSSSSAIACGFLYGVNEIFDLELSKSQMKALASQAENGIGLMGGMMDQSVIINGKKDHALLIDFLSHEEEYIPLDMGSYTFYLFESGQKHNLVTTQYNKRRRTCEEALHLLMKDKHFINTLREISEADLNLYIHDTKMKMRCLHVIHENERVEKAARAIRKSNFIMLGNLMNETHRSLSQLYEVSTPEIDILVKESLLLNQIKGARIMGGGFGGCTINLVKGSLSQSDIDTLKSRYKDKTGFEMNAMRIHPSQGISILESRKLK